MTRVLIWVILLLVLMLGMSWADPVVLEDLVRPETLTVGGGRIFVTEGAKVYLFDLETLKPIRTFGRSGEGPQEFKIYPVGSEAVILHGGLALVNSIGKVSWVTLDGEFRREVGTKYPFARFKPLCGGYVGSGEDVQNRIYFQTVHIYDGSFERVLEIYRRRDWAQEVGGNRVLDAGGLIVRTAAGRVYVGDRRTDAIAVFDGAGKRVLTVSHPFEKVPVTGKDIERYHDYYRSHPFFKAVYEQYKKSFVFPEVYPWIRDFVIDEDRLFVLTFKREGRRSVLVRFDLDGRYQGRRSVPFFDRDIQNPCPFAIHGGRLYQLVEDENEEHWRLHVTPLIDEEPGA